MKRVVVIACVMFFYIANCYAIELTQKQFDNVDVIHKELQKMFPTQYKYMNGSRKNMRVKGLDDLTALNAINSMDIDILVANKPDIKKRKKLKQKLKSLGLDDDDIEMLKIK